MVVLIHYDFCLAVGCHKDLHIGITVFFQRIGDFVQIFRNFLFGLLPPKMIDLYSVLCYHFAIACAEVDRVAADEGLKESLMRYAIESGAITERVYKL